MSIFRYNYPPQPDSGFWGNTTALIDWCEENYVVSPFIAEWSNTISNLMFMFVATYSTYSAYRNHLEFRFIIIGAMFFLVGVGSWLFHMTLKYRFQLLDELPMVYATCTPAWSLFVEFDWNKWTVYRGSITWQRQWFFFIIIFSLATILTYIYIVSHIVILFQMIYGAVTLIVVAISSSFALRLKASTQVKQNMYITMSIGIVLFSVGFIFWQLDQIFCSFWIHIRRTYLLLPLGTLLELHGWWHLLTGMGVYTYLVFLQYLRILTTNKSSDYKFIWRWAWIPEVVHNDLAITTNYSLKFRGDYITETNQTVNVDNSNSN